MVRVRSWVLALSSYSFLAWNQRSFRAQWSGNTARMGWNARTQWQHRSSFKSVKKYSDPVEECHHVWNPGEQGDILAIIIFPCVRCIQRKWFKVVSLLSAAKHERGRDCCCDVRLETARFRKSWWIGCHFRDVLSFPVLFWHLSRPWFCSHFLLSSSPPCWSPNLP